jgi:hypothetical protein
MSSKYVDDLVIGFWNIDGVYEGTGNSKTCKLDEDSIKSILTKFDIIGLAETHSGPDSSYTLDGYKIFHNCRPITSNNRYYGGISLLIKNELQHGVKIMTPSNSEIQWLRLSKSIFQLEKDIYLGTVYISPCNSPHNSKNEDDIFNVLESDVIELSKTGSCAIFGDFNARTNTEPDFCSEDNLDRYKCGDYKLHPK